ncbi:MAG TPA: response regulator [Chloroflexota bacterium]|nr:response regulator [Chloroflexota bacterium]HUM69724.1 response regulator [Chloroflexota bacterium]
MSSLSSSNFNNVTIAHSTVLLIENDRHVSAALNDILSDSGLRVLVAYDGLEGEELYRAHQDDIEMVILDWRLPRQDGRDTLRKIRQLNPNINVMVSSGYAAEEVLAQLDDQRPVTFLSKPFSVDKFLDQVHKLLA